LGFLLRSRGAAVRVYTALSCWRECRRLGLRFDVVEAPDYMAEGLVLAVLGTTPMVGHLHSPERLVNRRASQELPWDLRLVDALERFAVRRADVVTAPSWLLVHTLQANAWLAERRCYPHDGVQVIRYPIELDLWGAAPEAAGTTPTVLAVGRLDHRKAPEVLVDAAAELATKIQGLEVVFVGPSVQRPDGVPTREWLTARARASGAPCRIVEYVPREDLTSWYAAARVVVVASTFDNFPMVALEAMASRRAVVCTDRTGSAELLAGTGAGGVVPVGDAGRLAQALLPYLLDSELAAHAGRRARRVAAEHCNPERIAELREACYEEARRRWEASRRRSGFLGRRRRPG
jgi:glycogen synthase